jgi:hypothetical protein
MDKAGIKAFINVREGVAAHPITRNIHPIHAINLAPTT